jgi:hypothetical protein
MESAAPSRGAVQAVSLKGSKKTDRMPSDMVCFGRVVNQSAGWKNLDASATTAQFKCIQ